MCVNDIGIHQRVSGYVRALAIDAAQKYEVVCEVLHGGMY